MLCTAFRNIHAALGSRSCRPRADFPRAQNSGWRICIYRFWRPSLATAVRSGADAVAFVPLIIPARPRPAAYSTRPPASVPGSLLNPSLAPLPSSSVYNYVVNDLGSRLCGSGHGGFACASPRSSPPAFGRTCPAGRANLELSSRGRPWTLSRRGKGSVSDHRGRVVPAPRRSERFASPVPRCYTTALPVSRGLDVTTRRRPQLNNTPQGSWV